MFIFQVLFFFFFACQQDRSRNRFVILIGCAMLSVFGSNVAQFSGAGALGVLVMATVASYGWGDIEKVGVGLKVHSGSSERKFKDSKINYFSAREGVTRIVQKVIN